MEAVETTPVAAPEKPAQTKPTKRVTLVLPGEEPEETPQLQKRKPQQRPREEAEVEKVHLRSHVFEKLASSEEVSLRSELQYE